MEELKITVLGGVGEIGMNLYVYETCHDAVIVDIGIMFADRLHCGVDYVIPGFDYLLSIKDKLRAVLCTHGHEDHIGAVSREADKFNLPIYATEFTSELIKYRLEEGKTHCEIIIVKEGSTYNFGSISSVFIPVNHSIPGSAAIYLKCGNSSCLHLSDFSSCDIENLPQVDILLMDSTGACEKNPVDITEDDIKNELSQIFMENTGKIIFTTFASNVKRLNNAIEAARNCGRKVVIEGGAVRRIIGIASRLGLIYLKEDELVSAVDAYSDKTGKYLYIVSGCQGEQNSALYPVATGQRKAIKIGKGDVIIFSSRVIPGNTSVNYLVNCAIKLGAEVIEASDRPIHMSGHAPAKELERVLSHVKPKYFVPIHGEYKHLAAHKKIAVKTGVPVESVIIAETGAQAIFVNNIFKKLSTTEHSKYFYDERGGFTFGEQELLERKQIAVDGVIFIRYCSQKLPDINEKGFKIKTFGFKLNTEQSDKLLSMLKDERNVEFIDTCEHYKRIVKRFFRKYLQRRPFIEIEKEDI